MKPACSCLEHRGSPPPTTYGEHAFRLEEDTAEGRGWPTMRWRAVCTCSFRSQWQYQSASVAYHAWLSHVVRKLGRPAMLNAVVRSKSRGRKHGG